MRKSFYQRHRKFLQRFDGLLLTNPVLERGLVLAPVIVASYNCVNALILGLSFFAITFVTVLIASFLPKKIPYTIRVILYTLLAFGIFIPTALLMNHWFPQTIFTELGVFLPLLAANSLIVVKSESRFYKHRRGYMVVDLFCHCLGFLWAILLVGGLRELLGKGTLFGHPAQDAFTVPAAMMPFSGFILVGFLAAVVRRLKTRIENPPARRWEDVDSASDEKGGARL